MKELEGREVETETRSETVKDSEWVEIKQMPLYTSRSAIECYQRCPRKRYWNYLYDGTGIVPARKKIALTTGSAVHKGVEILLTGGDVETAVIEAKKTILEDSKVYKASLGRDLIEDERYEYREQMALAEGLVRVFARNVLHVLLNQYEIVAVEEEEIARLPVGGEVYLQGKVDAILRDKEDEEIYCLSLKTTKTVDDKRREDQARIDLQGLTEIWLTNQRLRRQIEAQKKVGEELKKYKKELYSNQVRNIDKVIKFMEGRKVGSRVRGVKTILLVKTEPRKQKNGRWETYSPLIRGYRRPSDEGWEYAHSFFYQKEDGTTGRLGTGWEPFYVWENKEVGGVKGWVEKIGNGEVQPELGDVLGRQVYIPMDSFRSDTEIEETIREIANQEDEIKYCLEYLENKRTWSMESFPMYRTSCVYPTKCEYWDCCYDYTIREDPLENGGFVRRVSHHEAERKQIAEMVKT